LLLKNNYIRHSGVGKYPDADATTANRDAKEAVYEDPVPDNPISGILATK